MTSIEEIKINSALQEICRLYKYSASNVSTLYDERISGLHGNSVRYVLRKYTDGNGTNPNLEIHTDKAIFRYSSLHDIYINLTPKMKRDLLSYLEKSTIIINHNSSSLDCRAESETIAEQVNCAQSEE